MKNINTKRSNHLFSVKEIIVITIIMILYVTAIALLVFMMVDTPVEVETYSFEAEITHLETASVYRKNISTATYYMLFFVDGDEAGCVNITAKDYAKLSEGQLIHIEARVIETRFSHFEQIEYSLG